MDVSGAICAAHIRLCFLEEARFAWTKRKLLTCYRNFLRNGIEVGHEGVTMAI
jgi:hypothetical protein